MKDALLYHAKKYPQMSVTDAVKIVYQSVYGPSHLIRDEKSALDRLIKEYNLCEQIIAPLYDPLGNGLIRVNLNALDHAGITPKQLFDKFIAAANAVKGTPEEFERQLAVLSEVVKEGAFKFGCDDFRTYLEEYRKAGYPPIRHSEEYRQLYKPAYRVVIMHRNFIQEDKLMTIEQAREQLKDLQLKMYAYNAASNALYLDGVTVAPKQTSEGRGTALGILAGESHKLFANEEVNSLLKFLEENKSELSQEEARQVELLRRSYDNLSKIPASEYVEYSQLVNDAGDVWHKAKEDNDFASFKPYLEKLVEANKKFAHYYNPDMKPYDALLNEFERGVDMKYLDNFFADMRAKLVPVIKKIGEAEQIDDSFLHKHYPAELQRKFSDRLMEIMGLDRNHCTIGETEHPFTLNFNSRDVRITTNYKEDNLVDSMYSVVHEGGHALYELGINPEYDYNCLAGGVSMGVHESQSRFYENIIGRSLEFAAVALEAAREFFPEQLAGVDANTFYRAINKAQPSLIRTEADELTYCFHVMVRYEIEKQLIGGTLEVADVPHVWNRLYKEYLGVDVPDDTHGCLQDSHWSGGAFGYFPSYALGSAYGAQMLNQMEKDIDVWSGVAKGDLSQVTAWLKEKVHKYGCLLEPAEIVKNACGGDFDPSFYTEYLVKKYSSLYNL